MADAPYRCDRSHDKIAALATTWRRRGIHAEKKYDLFGERNAMVHDQSVERPVTDRRTR